MRVLFQSSGLDPIYGGPPVSEASLCRALLTKCDLEILCPAEKLREDFAKAFGLTGVKPYSGKDIVRAFGSQTHWLSGAMNKAQVFHQNAHWKISTSMLSRLAGARGVPYVLHPRGIFFVGHRKVFSKHVFNTIFGYWAASHAAAVIALSEFEIPQLAPYSIARERIAVIPNGIDFPPRDETDSPWGSERPFVYLGRIEHRKNVLFLVEAFLRYRRAGGEARLALVGPVEFGYDELVRRKVAEAKLDSEVTFVAPQFEGAKWRYLKFARGVIYPSTQEAFGRVPFEALAAGTPPVIPSESGSAEYLGRFFPATTYRSGDLDSLVKALGAVDESRKNVPAAQAWVREELNWEKIAGKVLALYAKIARA